MFCKNGKGFCVVDEKSILTEDEEMLLELFRQNPERVIEAMERILKGT